MGRLTVVGFGPGGYEDMTNRAVKVIEEAEMVIGYTTYVELLKPLFPEKEYIATPMMQEIKRCEMAVELAGHRNGKQRRQWNLWNGRNRYGSGSEKACRY